MSSQLIHIHIHYSELSSLIQVSSADRNLMNAFREMSQMADRLNLPTNITDRANRLFKEIHDSKALKGGASNDAIAAACVYISCRQEGVPRTFKGECQGNPSVH